MPRPRSVFLKLPTKTKVDRQPRYHTCLLNPAPRSNAFAFRVESQTFMIQIDSKLTETGLRKKVERLFSTSAHKIRSLDSNWDTAKGSPVFTVGGKYTSRGWTEWTQGFQFGSAILQFDATGDKEFLEIGRDTHR